MSTAETENCDYASGQSEAGKSPLSSSLSFLKGLTEKKSTRGMILQIHPNLFQLETKFQNSRRLDTEKKRAQTR